MLFVHPSVTYNRKSLGSFGLVGLEHDNAYPRPTAKTRPIAVIGQKRRMVPLFLTLQTSIF